jgi:hypothetical protein
MLAVSDITVFILLKSRKVAVCVLYGEDAFEARAAF